MLVKLLCPTCSHDMEDVYPEPPTCYSCGTSYGVIGRVPVIAQSSSVDEKVRPAPAFVEAIAELIAKPSPHDVKQEVDQIFRRVATFRSIGLQVEADQFVRRLVNSGLGIPDVSDGGNDEARSGWNVAFSLYQL